MTPSPSGGLLLLSRLFSRRCLGCGTPSGMKELCGRCEDHPVWRSPAQEITDHEHLVRSVFEDIGPAAHLFRLAKIRGNRMASDLLMDKGKLEGLLPSGSELLVPVPPSKRRLIQRDLSFPDIFSCRLSRMTGIPMVLSGVVRTEDAPQKERTRRERKKMVSSPPFRVESKFFRKWPTGGVVLVDDIFVTGSTLKALEGVLSREGIGVRAFVTLLFRRRLREG